MLNKAKPFRPLFPKRGDLMLNTHFSYSFGSSKRFEMRKLQA